jgi:hypothetical protein
MLQPARRLVRARNRRPLTVGALSAIGLLLVGCARVADARPPGALLAVRSRDSWFYIDDRDFRSKATFVLLSQIYALQGVPPATGSPALTLPVGR